ncbi:MAG: universal stress protein [Desulfobacterales bacterium]|nr:universal stress protein [Desulfobacterales bacterium]
MNTTIPTVEIKRILYATDLSENARYAMAYAVSLANTYCAQIVILHVIDETPDYVDAGVEGYIGADEWEAIKKRNLDETRKTLTGKKRGNRMVREVLERFCQNLRPGTNDHEVAMDETVIKMGNPVAQILETAEEKNCDLIVMGTHGRGALVDTMMGSTTNRVSRRSRIPVLSVRLPDKK